MSPRCYDLPCWIKQLIRQRQGCFGPPKQLGPDHHTSSSNETMMLGKGDNPTKGLALPYPAGQCGPWSRRSRERRVASATRQDRDPCHLSQTILRAKLRTCPPNSQDGASTFKGSSRSSSVLASSATRWARGGMKSSHCSSSCCTRPSPSPSS